MRLFFRYARQNSLHSTDTVIIFNVAERKKSPSQNVLII